MNLKPPHNKTGFYLRALHWAMASIIIGLLVVGFFMTTLDDFDSAKWLLYKHHKSFGMLVFFLLLVRLVLLALNNGALITAIPRSRRVRVTRIATVILYFSMFTMPLSGYLQTAPYGVAMFGLPVPVIRGEFLIAGLGSHAHLVLANLLVAMICLHVCVHIYYRILAHELARFR